LSRRRTAGALAKENAMLLRLIQLYVIGIIAMLIYLLVGPELSFGDAIQPALLWPKTLYEMIQASGSGTTP
jgi:hypothetical protein